MPPTKENPIEAQSITKKRESRDEEATLADGYLYILIGEFGFNVQLKQTKHSTKTIKLYCAEELYINGGIHVSQEEIQKNGKKLEEQFPNDLNTSESMNAKQMKRSKEAEISNGYLQMLINAGYTPDFKGTRSAKKTIKMYRIKSMTSPTQVTISKELLMKFGKRLDEIAKKEFDKSENKDATITITIEMLKEYEESIGEVKLSDVLTKNDSKHQNTKDIKKSSDNTEDESVTEEIGRSVEK